MGRISTYMQENLLKAYQGSYQDCRAERQTEVSGKIL